ncbi:MAG: sulfite exporter TauE/SafE family protein [bacterium]|nr:sulfite exporter TauE/SafE family protein [bacterium]
MEIPEPTNVVLAVMGATLFGLVSVPHCFGMCGPLHLTVCLSGGARSFRALSTFNLGRILGYTALGLVCGLFGGQLTDLFGATPAHGAEAPAAHAPADGAAVEGSDGTIAAPHSCCEAADGTDAAASSESGGPHGGGKPIWRRCLMFLFPAAILLLSGIKALRRKPGVVGEGSGGLFVRLFNRARKGGPLAFGLAASLIPCGMLYYALAIAVSTLSPFLGGVFMLVYCVTITFFLQLGMMVGTTFGRKLGPKVDRAFPWLAFAGAGVYVTLFLVR